MSTDRREEEQPDLRHGARGGRRWRPRRGGRLGGGGICGLVVRAAVYIVAVEIYVGIF